jgi:hypothetical protein
LTSRCIFLYNPGEIREETDMKFLRKLLTPALLLSSLVGGSAAVAQQQPGQLPDAPVPARDILKIPPMNFNYAASRSTVEYTVPKPASASSSPLGDGFIGKMAGYVDRHSNESQLPFDFAMGYTVKDRFTFMAGSIVDMRTHSGQYEATRQSLRVTTGLPDWETQNLRNMMVGGPVNSNLRGGQGFAVGVKISLGGKR